jgi:superoxide dismutase, Cu-Zn family
MRPALALAIATAMATSIGSALAQSEQRGRGEFIDINGQAIGTVTLSETPHGVLVEVDLTGLPEGEHGFHIHETGRCDAADGFESAGDHFAPRDHDHGFLAEGGFHAGDMPNQFVAAAGVLRAHVFNPNVTLGSGEGSLFDDDGSALVVHADADDYRTDPAGEAGDRIACAVIERG